MIKVAFDALFRRKITCALLLLCCFCVSDGLAQDISLQEYLNRKQYNKVVARADSLSPADSANYELMYIIGQGYEGMLKYREAFRIYQHCLTFDTLNVDLLNTLARTAINLGKAKEAEQYFHTVLANDSANFYANYQLARLNQQLGNYEIAIDKYQDLLQDDDTNTTILRNVGDCYTRLEQYEGAAMFYFLAYNYNRENAGLASALVNTMLKIGTEDYVLEALAIVDTALYYNPGNVVLRQNKGMALFMNREYNKADSIYTDLLADGDSSYNTVKYGGASRYYAGRYLQAARLLKDAYEMDTTAIDATILYGAVLGRTFDRERALELFDHAELLMQPDELWFNTMLQSRAETISRMGKRNESSRLFYALWERTGRLNVLERTAQNYWATKIDDYQNNDDRQRGVFLQVTYLREFFRQNRNPREMYVYRYFLESLYEDMFFRNVTEEPMLSPDGKRSTINIVDVRSLINRLPEVPDATRQQWRQAEEERIRRQQSASARN